MTVEFAPETGPVGSPAAMLEHTDPTVPDGRVQHHAVDKDQWRPLPPR
jgi:hypothetical protein